MDLRDGQDIVCDVLEHVEGDDHVNRRIGHRQSPCVRLQDGKSAVLSDRRAGRLVLERDGVQTKVSKYLRVTAAGGAQVERDFSTSPVRQDIGKEIPEQYSPLAIPPMLPFDLGELADLGNLHTTPFCLEEAALLSVVVPVFNEQDVLALFEERARLVLDGLRSDYEVLVVNDGSLDETPSSCATCSRDGRSCESLSCGEMSATRERSRPALTTA